MAAEAYRPAGEGTFGQIIRPALPNGNETFGSNTVTKIIYRPENYTSMMKRQGNVERILGKTKGTTATPYAQVYQGTNLPANVFAKITGSQQGRMIQPTNHISMLRMPYLGLSLDDYMKRGSFDALRALPFSVIRDQIRGLFELCVKMNQAGYIHGDMKSKNIMIDPSTGELHLIDYDTFNTVDGYYAERFGIMGEFQQPPEALLIPYLANLTEESLPSVIEYSIQTDGSGIRAPRYQNYIAYTVELYEPYLRSLFPGKEFIQSTFDHAVDNMLYETGRLLIEVRDRAQLIKEAEERKPSKKKVVALSSKERAAMRADITKQLALQRVLPMFDSYGMGICMTQLLLLLYPEMSDEVRHVYEVVQRAADMRLSERWSAIMVLQALDNKNVNQVRSWVNNNQKNNRRTNAVTSKKKGNNVKQSKTVKRK